MLMRRTVLCLVICLLILCFLTEEEYVSGDLTKKLIKKIWKKKFKKNFKKLKAIPIPIIFPLGVSKSHG